MQKAKAETGTQRRQRQQQ